MATLYELTGIFKQIAEMEGIDEETKLDTLATKAGSVEEIRGALSLPYEYYLKQKSEIKALAKIHDCEIILVDAEYTLTYPNGEEVSKIIPKESNLFDDLMEAIKQF
ncbi:TPA: hypothetical protein ACYSYY_000100 [Streptococcus suis]